MGLVVVPKTRSMLSRFVGSPLTWAVVCALGAFAGVIGLALDVITDQPLWALVALVGAVSNAWNASALFSMWQEER